MTGILGARGQPAPPNVSVKAFVPVPETALANPTSKTPVAHPKTLRNEKNAALFNAKKTAKTTKPLRQPQETTALAVGTPHQVTATMVPTIQTTATIWKTTTPQLMEVSTTMATNPVNAGHRGLPGRNARLRTTSAPAAVAA